MPTAPRPNLQIQTATVAALGDTNVVTGSLGPAAFDPFLSAFSDVISATTLASNPFDDAVAGVDAGDQIVFVVALTNFGSPAYDVKLRNSIPVGFAVPDAGDGLTVTDGAGNPLGYVGGLFDPTYGLTLLSPVGAYDANSGSNVILITFTLQATTAVAVPQFNLTDTAQLVSYAAQSGGANIAASNSTSLVGNTAVQTAAFTVASTAAQPAGLLSSGQTASFDITVTLPEGTLQDVRIDEALPMSGNAGFALVSAQILSMGAHLSASAPAVVQANGAVALGTVVNTPDNLQTADDQITVRVTVKDGGTTSGTGSLVTTVSTANPNLPGQRFSQQLVNTLPVAKPNTPPTIGAVSAAQNTTSSTPVLPFAGIIFADPDPGQVQTLTIHLSDASLGTLSGAFAVNGAGDAVLVGSAASVQAAARGLTFNPAAGATGSERFTLTLTDGIDAAVDTQTTVTISAAARPSTLASFVLSPQTVLTSTPSGSTTVVPLQSYSGPISNVANQFLYDGAGPLAIVAGSDNLLVSSKADATAVQLHGGVNLLDMEAGSSFLVGGTGADQIILHADAAKVTWNTLANFGPADSLTIYGFVAGVSKYGWQDSAGAPGWMGATLHFDLDGNGTIDSSLTFAGASAAIEPHIKLTPGYIAGQYFVAIASN